ncbi:hypothetical protein ACFPRL_17680 [Pseudoclavibacter helvolus]
MMPIFAGSRSVSGTVTSGSPVARPTRTLTMSSARNACTSSLMISSRRRPMPPAAIASSRNVDKSVSFDEIMARAGALAC